MRLAASDSIQLNMRKWGSGRPTVLLLHGFADGGFVWDHVAPLLLQRPRLAAMCFDMRGHGDSDWDPETRYAASDHATDISHAIRSLGLKDLHLIGHSLGAEVAIRIAAADPGRVASLVLVDGGPDLRQEALEYLFREFRSQPWHYPSIEHYTTSLAARLSLAERSLLQQVASNALRADPSGGFVLKCDPALYLGIAGRGQQSLWDSLQSVRCPVLVVRGAVSAVLPRDAAIRMTQRIPGGRLVSIPLAGHAVMLDNPAAFATAVNSFLESARPSCADALDAK